MEKNEFRSEETMTQEQARMLKSLAEQAFEPEAFNERLQKLADEIKPAGKLVKPKGVGAMFT